MQSISQLYSRYYSGKYNSYGPLYRRRYYSEPINDEERLEVVMRYVHQEPQRLGLCVPQKAQKPQKFKAEALDEWAWSSWHEYVGLGSDLPNVCEQPDACHDLTVDQWRELLSEPLPEGTKCLEPKEYRAPKPTETQVLSMVRLMTTATTWDEFRAFPKDEKLKTIKQLLQNGASIRQMEKLTGIGRGVIQNL
jgi:hypothetical protein